MKSCEGFLNFLNTDDIGVALSFLKKKWTYSILNCLMASNWITFNCTKIMEYKTKKGQLKVEVKSS